MNPETNPELSPQRAGQWYWCLTDHRVVERGGCSHADRLGPYDTPAEAEHALQNAQVRGEAWDDDPNWQDD